MSAVNNSECWRQLFSENRFLQTHELDIDTLYKIHSAAKENIIKLTELENTHLARLFSDAHDRFFARRECIAKAKALAFIFFLFVLLVATILIVKFLL